MYELTEQTQQDWAAIAVKQSQTLEVVTQQDYDNAAELCKDIKSRINQITDYWKSPKDKAYSAWKDICAKEKQLLDPFTKAETSIKDKMKEFQRQKMEEERRQREELERRKHEEAEILLKEAAKADEAGDSERSDFMFEAAENVQNMQIEQPKPVKTEGTAAKTTWKARVTNPALVPIEIAGIQIRPIDTKALDTLARASKGSMKIPGVEFYEDVQIAIRSR